ncbi:DUF1501 domain-containing protein [Exilibacterium tricleocarpae]|uniref:DUF1501 domain-containing protein n=1 Tax=Exilibacterium tricleocarpae TaxID=2591008 RepID=A0A545SRW8_9GAMM|nr:DUF1501 domain-containing protein [Exilibacterium tricleocarpae]TQV67707.1 DUF1501 domain-containing protein [Exilibacterium tricleocarpae]
MKKKTSHTAPANPLSRRSFLGGCAALGATPLLSSILQLKLMNSAYAAGLTPASIQNPDEYRAMVCVFLFGGNDSFNMLAPYESTEYNHYANVRTDLALPRGQLQSINDNRGRPFGLHSNMAAVKDLYNAGKLAFVANLGTLVRPTTLSDYNNGIALPRGLFSHNDQQQAWQTSVPESEQAIGWGGRLADLVNSVNPASPISMNISLNSINIFQNGEAVTPYVISNNGSVRLQGYNGSSFFNQLFTRTTDSALAQSYQNLLKQNYARNRRDAIDTATAFDSATRGASITTRFPNSALGAQLKMVARTISARNTLGAKRQTFFVSVGGYDNHDELLTNQRGLLSQLSAALGAFYQATTELGISDKVTTFTASDFGRTLTSNGRGSDHAWGGNQIVMGGAVNGGHVFGDYPTNLSEPRGADGNSIDAGRGRLLPTTSTDEFYAELARWFGVPNTAALQDVLPNIRNFYSAGGSQLPIGFLNA